MIKRIRNCENTLFGSQEPRKHTWAEEPSERAEEDLQVIFWAAGSLPDLWPWKNKMDFARASL